MTFIRHTRIRAIAPHATCHTIHNIHIHTHTHVSQLHTWYLPTWCAVCPPAAAITAIEACYAPVSSRFKCSATLHRFYLKCQFAARCLTATLLVFCNLNFFLISFHTFFRFLSVLVTNISDYMTASFYRFSCFFFFFVFLLFNVHLLLLLPSFIHTLILAVTFLAV